MQVQRTYVFLSVLFLCIFIVSSGFGAWASPAQAASNPDTYIVRPGDTLYSIARRYHTSVERLQQLNHLPDPNLIRVGQKLIIPTSPGVPPAGSSSRAEFQVEGGTAPLAGRASVASGACLYVVQKGDWLFKVARKFRVLPWDLMKANDLSVFSRLYVGQVLRIPKVPCPVGATPAREGTRGSQEPTLRPTWAPPVLSEPREVRPTPTAVLRSPTPMLRTIPEIGMRSAPPAGVSPRVRILPTSTPTPAMRKYSW